MLELGSVRIRVLDWFLAIMKIYPEITCCRHLHTGEREWERECVCVCVCVRQTERNLGNIPSYQPTYFHFETVGTERSCRFPFPLGHESSREVERSRKIERLKESSG